MPNDPASLEKAIAYAQSMPEKNSRSYLLPAEEIIFELLSKKYSFRDILTYLNERLDLHPSLSTLHHFYKKASKRRMLKAKANRQHPSSGLPPTAKPVLPPDQESSSTEDGNAAIRALKARVRTGEAGVPHRLFDFDESKPLINKPEPKNKHQ